MKPEQAYPADFAKELKRLIRSQTYDLMLNKYNRPKAERRAQAIVDRLTPPIIKMLQAEGLI